MRPTPPTAQSTPMNVRLVLKRLRLRIEAAELPVQGLLHAELDGPRREQRGARLARQRVLDLHAFLVEAVDEATERFFFVTEIATLHAHPDMPREQHRERDEVEQEA